MAQKPRNSGLNSMNMQNKQRAPAVRGQKSCAVGPVINAKTRHAKSHHESADTYVGVIALLDARHRLILCKDALQWIIQVKDGQRSGQARWAGKSYITCPEAVINASRSLCGPLSGDTMATLWALPSKPGAKS
jgi:hypothetical protein